MSAAPSPITVRPLEAADRPGWDRLWAGYLAFYRADLPADVAEVTFARLLSGAPRAHRGLIAEVGGQAVGLAHFQFHRTCWKIADVCYLQDLYADPGARGTGVGRALIAAVYAAADAAGAPAVYWMTAEDNHTARRLYDRIGVKTPFIEYSRT